jgi:hypothetical protein
MTVDCDEAGPPALVHPSEFDAPASAESLILPCFPVPANDYTLAVDRTGAGLPRLYQDFL